VVTHDPALAARADRRVHIVDGKIHETIPGGGRAQAAEPVASVDTTAAES
jgi:lipoprotein-releasing system ATP-binding protein